MDKEQRTRWGGGAPPSLKRIDPIGFARAATVYGAGAFGLALVALWRPVLGAPAPNGALLDHALHVAACAANWISPKLFVETTANYHARLEYLRSVGQLAPIAWRLAAAGLVSLAPMAWAAWRYLRPRDGLTFLRGSKRYSGAEAVKQLNKRLAKRASARPDHPLAPEVPYSSDLWTRHALLIAGTGAGKSTCLKPLLSRIIKADERLLLYDPKGDFTRAFGKPILLAPWDARTWAWDIAADIRNIGAARRFAAALVKEGSDPMWANAARQVMVGSIMMLRAECGTGWGWRDLARTLALPQAQLLPIMRFYHQEAVRAVERASVTTQGVLINLSAFCSAIFDLADAWGDVAPERRISFIDWLTRPKKGQRQIILQGNGSYPEITKGYVEGIFSVIGGLVNSVEMDDDPERKVWIVLDELPQCGKIPILPLFSVGRSRGIRCVAACQDLSQLEEIHGKDAVRSLVSMTGSILIGQMSQGDTAEALAKALGSREVERRNESRSYGRDGSQSVSYAREDLALYKPSELGSRLGLDSKRAGVIMALALEGNAYELFWPFFKSQDKRNAHVPSRWALGEGAPPDCAHPFDVDVAPPEAVPEPSMGAAGSTAPRAGGSDSWVDLGLSHAAPDIAIPVGQGNGAVASDLVWLNEEESQDFAWMEDASADDETAGAEAAMA
ncbi:type IV secretion system DNA-binding domain-containing protein [Pseudoduganella aquatica]|uniref:Type IV secretion system DNA-binding domain-containing protein n=1 Tax=Pseudoduganella aquatica TaxID=2660641 RepID=A0A7X4HIM1_9BURK|nr:type IV secretion system DNA-binding domain-containing protein [Pseudoduganella aquatica]MYN11242.1 type IV secretion system DNA-binding domain-containing protein [Pseudoduganella aquatica]